MAREALPHLQVALARGVVAVVVVAAVEANHLPVALVRGEVAMAAAVATVVTDPAARQPPKAPRPRLRHVPARPVIPVATMGAMGMMRTVMKMVEGTTEMIPAPPSMTVPLEVPSPSLEKRQRP